MSLEIGFFVSSILSAYWNGAATYYRGLAGALHRRGHRLHFFEPDAFSRQQHRDLDELPWGDVVVYDPEDRAGIRRCLVRAAAFDFVVKASGVGGEFFFEPARRLPERRFVLGGAGWDDAVHGMPNLRWVRHVYTGDHNAFNVSAKAVINISRDDMAQVGWSPATRVFEAAGHAKAGRRGVAKARGRFPGVRLTSAA